MMDEAQSSSPNRAELSKLGGQLSYAERGMAASNVAMKDQARRGLDPTGQYRSIEDTMSTISGKERSQAANQTVAGGVDWKSFQTELRNTAESLKSLNKEFQEGTKTEKEYREEASKLASKYSGMSTVEAAGRSAGQNTSGQGFFEKIKNSISGTGLWAAGGEALNQAGRVASYMGVQSAEQRMDLDIGFANMSNKRFDDQRAGLAGNMAAARRSGMFGGGNAYDKAIGVGDERAKWAGIGLGAQGTGQAIKAGANASSAASSGDAQGAIDAATVGAANAAITATDAAKGITTGGASIRGQQQSLALGDANSHVSDVGRQRTFDTITGINKATFGGGSNRQRLVREIGSTSMVSKMADAMISQEQMASLTAQGVQQLGGQMNAGIMSGAGRAQKSGLMSAGDYMSSMGAMTNVGGGKGDLESIMRSAVAAGMDNSKNIQQMVTATADLAGRTAAAGLNTAAGAGAMISKGVQGLEGILPENMRATAAAAAGGFLTSTSKDKSLDLSNVIAASKVRQAFPNADITSRSALSTMSLTEIDSIKAQAKKGDFSAVTQMGLLDQLTKVDKVTGKRILDDVAMKAEREVIVGKDLNKLSDVGIDAPNEKVRAGVQGIAKGGAFDLKSETGQYLARKAREKEVSVSAIVSELQEGGPAQGDIGGKGTNKADAALRAREISESRLFAKGLENFGGKFGEFAVRMEKIAKTWPIDDKAAEKMSHSFDELEKFPGQLDAVLTKVMSWLDTKLPGSGGKPSVPPSNKAGTGKAKHGTSGTW
jgi:hypothetical protein